MMAALRPCLRRAAAASVGLVGLAGLAHADPTMEPASSAAERCLAPAPADRIKPVYPPELYEARIGAAVAARFEFTAPDRPPLVVFDGSPRWEFRDAVQAYSKQLRVPCMEAAYGHVKLSQTFDFVPNDGRKVAWTRPRDDDDPRRDALLDCVVKPRYDLVQYPGEMLRQRRDGVVLARLTYTAPDQPPTWEILSDGGSHLFVEAIQPWLRELRMPCHSGAPVPSNVKFNFLIDQTSRRYVLRDMALPAFLAAVRPIPANSAFFDTHAMKCPFDVRLTVRQPFEPNKIEELEEDVPERHALLDWLGDQRLNLDPPVIAQLYGQQMTVHVPCVKIDL